MSQERAAVCDLRVIDVHTERHKLQKVNGRDFYALSYRYEGEVALHAEDVHLLSTPNTVTFTPRGVPYSTAVYADTRMTVVHFHLTHDIAARLPSVVAAEGGELKQLFERLSATYRVSDANCFECMSIFYQILSILERTEHRASAIPTCIGKVKEMIDKGFADPALSIGAMADAVGVSDSYLRRVFKRLWGVSPVEYLMSVRIRHAKNLLQTEYYTISEIARQSGFGSSCYFIQCFRRQTAETPTAYRKRKSGLTRTNGESAADA